MDFTLKKYRYLLQTLKDAGYEFYTFEAYLLNKPISKFIILRHDIDKNPYNALKIAELESSLNIKSSFYFRIADSVFNAEIVLKIKNMGHEIGYHYRDLVDNKGDVKAAIQSFSNHLQQMREIVAINTITMDGCPLSKYDNHRLWDDYDYRNFGIIGDSHFDIDYTKVLYLTDTGRCWNAKNTNKRDKVGVKQINDFRTTNDIIQALKSEKLADAVLINAHPQRWTDNLSEWLFELVYQNFKNIIKLLINRK